MSRSQAYYQRNKERIRDEQRARSAQKRINALMHYSNGRMLCECCGEHRVEFLCIDHINGGGNADRNKLNLWGNAFSRSLEYRGWPDGLRVLCNNCNQAISNYGSCPHGTPTFVQIQELLCPAR